MNVRDAEAGFVIRLERGEELIVSITDFCTKRGIRAAIFQGIGAVEKVEIGYYDLGKKEYFFRNETGIFEVASMQGNVALVNDEPFVHVHAVLSRCDETLECIGAHIKEAFVAVTLEIYLTPLNVSLSRKHDESIGLKLLDI